MKELIKEVELITKNELKRANENYPLFASNHEGSAVIREEIEEAHDAVDNMDCYYERLWNGVKANGYEREDVRNLKTYAVLSACECIQVAAMCEKWLAQEQGNE